MTEKTISPVKPDPKGKESPPEKSANGNWALRFLLVLIVFLLGAGATVYFLPVLKDRMPILAKWVGERTPDNSILARKVDMLESRLAGQGLDIQALKAANNNSSAPDPLLRERLERLEQAKNRKDDMSQSARIDMLLSRMSQLEAAFVPLSKSLADAQEMRLERSQLAEVTAAQAEQLDNITRRLGRVEDYAARDNSGALIAFRIGELRRMVTSGAAFGPEIDRLSAMISRGSPALNSQITEALGWLSQHRDGIAARGKLRDQFNDLIPMLIRAKSSHADDPWWTRAYNSTRNLIMVRKTENTAGENLDGIIANAHKMLDQLDLTQALALLKQLPGTMREMLEVWTRRAEIYLQADHELRRIESLTAAYYLGPEKAEEAETVS